MATNIINNLSLYLLFAFTFAMSLIAQKGIINRPECTETRLTESDKS